MAPCLIFVVLPLILSLIHCHAQVVGEPVDALAEAVADGEAIKAESLVAVIAFIVALAAMGSYEVSFAKAEK